MHLSLTCLLNRSLRNNGLDLDSPIPDMDKLAVATDLWVVRTFFFSDIKLINIFNDQSH